MRSAAGDSVGQLYRPVNSFEGISKLRGQVMIELQGYVLASRPPTACLPEGLRAVPAGSSVALAMPKGDRWLSICRRYALIRILTVFQDAPQVVTLVDKFVSCLRPSRARARALPAL